MNNSSKALTDIKVLEYAQFVSGPYCTKLLADMGAEVIKIEAPASGDEARTRGPFLGDLPHPEHSGLFLYLNTDKMGITLDPTTSRGKRIFRDLVRWADVLVENYPLGYMKKLRLDFGALKKLNPKLIMASITPFGQSGPYKDYKSYYLNTFHAGGEGYCLPGPPAWLLFPDRPPVKGGGFLGEYDSGLAAANAILFALLAREETGQGEYIDVSQQEVLIGCMRHELGACNDGYIESRASRALPVGGLMQCKDGFVDIIPLEARHWEALMELMGNPSWAKEEKYRWSNFVSQVFGDVEARMQAWQDVNDFIEGWIVKHTKEEIHKASQDRGCPMGPVFTAEEVVSSEQLRVRGYFSEVEHSEAGRFKYPGYPYKFSKTPWRLERPAPLLGQHNEEVYCKRMGYSKEEMVKLRQTGVI
ncbi:MAG: CoA transferase [Chloroflexi bacterium]|nr:CoA transferase [Chloroflexota bacterium]